MKLQIVDECNLNCADCDHLAPIARRWHAPVAVTVYDLVTLSRVVPLRQVIVFGGEPLLHERLPSLLRLTRLALPTTVITVQTNGLRLIDFLKEHHGLMHDLDVRFKVTEYAASAGVTTLVHTRFPDVVAEVTRLVNPDEVIAGNQLAGVKRLMFRPRFASAVNPRRALYTCYCKAHERFTVCMRAGKVYTCPMTMCLPMALGTEDDGVSVVELDVATVRRVASGPTWLCARCLPPEHGLPWRPATEVASWWSFFTSGK